MNAATTTDALSLVNAAGGRLTLDHSPRSTIGTRDKVNLARCWRSGLLERTVEYGLNENTYSYTFTTEGRDSLDQAV